MAADAGCREEHHPRHREHERDHRRVVLQRGVQDCHVGGAVPEQLHDGELFCQGVQLTAQYVGNDSLYTFTFEHEKRPDCPVCGGESVTAEVGKDWTLEKLVSWIEDRQEL